MKHAAKLLVILALYLFSGSSTSTAQNKYSEYAYHSDNATYSYCSIGTSNGWMMAVNSHDCQPDHIVKLSPNGSVKIFPSIHSPYPDMNTEVFVAIETDPDGFIFAGKLQNNYSTFAATPFLYKVDSAGRLIWKTTFTAADFKPDSPPNDIWKVLVEPNGDIFGITNPGFIFKLHADGKKVWIKPFLNGYDIINVAGGLAIAEGDKIALIDTSGAQTGSYSMPNGLFVFHLWNAPHKGFYSVFLNSNANALHFGTFDSSGNLTDSFTVFKSLTDTSDIDISDSTLYFTTRNLLISYTATGVKNWQFVFPQNTQNYDVAVSGNEVAVSGMQVFKNSSCAFIKTFNKANGATDPINRDIDISSISSKNFSTGKDSMGQVSSISADVDISVKNSGPELIDSLFLDVLPDSGQTCADTIIGFQHLNLASGSSTLLHLGTITHHHPVPYQNGYVFTFKANAISPNGKLDGNAGNDSVNFSTFYSGVYLPQPGASAIKAYPNPAQSLISIDAPEPGQNNTLEIVNITGKSLKVLQNIKGHAEVDISCFPPGMYFVRFQNEKGVVTQKIMKE